MTLLKRLAITVGVALAAIISGFFLKGTFDHWIFVIAVGMYLGAPLLLFMTLWLGIGLMRRGHIPKGLRTTFFVSTVIGGSLLLSLGTGAAYHSWKIREARNYVARIVPKLDRYRQNYGRYPKTLAELNEAPPPPLLSHAHSYSAEPDHFQFRYWDEAGLMSAYYFDSQTREWVYLD